MNKGQELVLTDLTSTHDVPFKILNHRIETETDAGRRQDLIRKLDALRQVWFLLIQYSTLPYTLNE